jgi:hypothetical protein
MNCLIVINSVWLRNLTVIKEWWSDKSNTTCNSNTILAYCMCCQMIMGHIVHLLMYFKLQINVT